MKKPIAMAIMTVAFAVLQALVSLNARAQQEQPTLMSEMDLDEDGKISIREAVANPHLLASFGKIDTDGDGKISAQELAETQVLELTAKRAD